MDNFTMLNDITREVVKWHGIEWKTYLFWYKACTAGWGRVLTPDEHNTFVSIEEFSELLWLAMIRH